MFLWNTLEICVNDNEDDDNDDQSKNIYFP